MILRPIERDDLPWIRDLRNSPEVYSHVRERRLLTLADQEAWYDRLTADGGRTMRYYATAPAQGIKWRCQGTVGLTAIDWLNRSAEVAVMMLNPDVEPVAVNALTTYAFQTLGLHRLYTDTLTDRRAQVFRDAGFSQEGEAREAYWRDGRWVTAIRWFRLSTPPPSTPETPPSQAPG
jgi:RimJ/RimL family protein N-acetyltransferase